MSYRTERDEFIDRMAREGLPRDAIFACLRAATSLQRFAELACSSEAADRDRVTCPASPVHLTGPRVLIGKERRANGPCLCDGGEQPEGWTMEDCAICGGLCVAAEHAYAHTDIPRITLQAHQAEQRIEKVLPEGWTADHQGDPRGYVFRLIPPSYAERNAGKDHHNRESIGVPSGPTGLRF